MGRFVSSHACDQPGKRPRQGAAGLSGGSPRSPASSSLDRYFWEFSITLVAVHHVVEHLVEGTGPAFVVLSTHFGAGGPSCEGVNATLLFHRRLEHPLDLCGCHDGPPFVPESAVDSLTGLISRGFRLLAISEASFVPSETHQAMHA